MAQFHWDPASYLDLMSLAVPDYERLQDMTVGATGMGATRILELGTGTGETARRMLARHPTANLIGLDASTQMLEHARAGLPGQAPSTLPDGDDGLPVLSVGRPVSNTSPDRAASSVM